MTASGSIAQQPFRSELQAGETLQIVHGVPHIVYHRNAGSDCPLAVFLTGGGHLARVAYGHTGCEPRDFIDHWLSDARFSLLALSYPSDHAAFEVRLPEITIPQWTASVAALIHATVQDYPCREIVVMGWSMAGRSVAALASALRSHGLDLSLFVSLAATPPLPGLLPTPLRDERFTSEGFWDSSTRHAQWLQQVSKQIGTSGRPAIASRDYLDRYVINSPFPLRGQPHDTHSGSDSEIAAGIGAFS